MCVILQKDTVFVGFGYRPGWYFSSFLRSELAPRSAYIDFLILDFIGDDHIL